MTRTQRPGLEPELPHHRPTTDGRKDSATKSGISSGRNSSTRPEKQFARYGLDKTTIADLTGPVNIAPSTFYQFFDPKDECYLAVLDRETERFYERAIAPLEETDDPERAIREYLRITFEE